MKRKKIIKWIEQESKKLPPEWYYVPHKLNKEMIIECQEGEKEDFTVPVPEGEEGEPKRMRVINRVQEAHPVNHKRRLMTIFDNEGFEGVEAYFNKRKFVRKDGESVK